MGSQVDAPRDSSSFVDPLEMRGAHSLIGPMASVVVSAPHFTAQLYCGTKGAAVKVPAAWATATHSPSVRLLKDTAHPNVVAFVISLQNK
jgi:hypothetical protein